ncbi:MAG: phosphotransferase family protein [Rhodobacteraceae bacterium]|nr:phosphotransferase family protein [Paracoccaceae bacterium]
MTPQDRVRALPIWKGVPQIAPLDGGITNQNFVVTDAQGKSVVRIGADMPEHHISRKTEMAVSRAAHAAGIAPAVRYHTYGALVIDHIAGRTLTAADLCDDAQLDLALALVMQTHRDLPRYLRGPAPLFWVFHTLRDYAATLREKGSAYLTDDLLQDAAELEGEVGAINLVFGHNDLLPANFMHDGERMWLIDWEYGGFNSPLFDLGALANAGLTHAQENRVLRTYFGAAPTADLWHRYRAMKAASALREAMWSMVQEVHSALPVDFAAYTAVNLATYRAAFDAFRHP